jgi:hypothetical protein
VSWANEQVAIMLNKRVPNNFMSYVFNSDQNSIVQRFNQKQNYVNIIIHLVVIDYI